MEPTASTADCITCIFGVSPTLLTPIAIIASALIATGAAKVGINYQRAIARKRATLDLILRCDETDFQKLIDEYCELRGDPAGLARYAKKSQDLSPEDLKSVAIIDRYLNYYEIVAVGIKQDILDKETYGLWMKAGLVNDWNYARIYIADVRKLSPLNAINFAEFETLAIEWGGEPLPPEQTELDLESTK